MSRAAPSMSPKLLIVEDDADMRRALRAALGRSCAIIEAESGAEALRLVEDERPQLMLLDIALPDLSGLDVLAEALKRLPALTVVMLTGDDDVETAALALDGGARAYVTKPFDPEYLRGEIERLLAPGQRAGDPPWRVLGGGDRA